ncbi:MAG: VWA domain-containing protein [Candidatus Acidiferrales bacterium]
MTGIKRLRAIAILALGMGVAASVGLPRGESSTNPASSVADAEQKQTPTGTAAPQQNATAVPPQRILSVTTRLVRIAVLVQDKSGKPITGLTQKDFNLFDDKKPQAIQFFAVETSQALPAGGQLQIRDTYTNEMAEQNGVPSNLTVILLDSFNTGFLDQATVRNQVVKFLLTIQPQDRVALYALGSHLRVLHDFTSDATSLLEALKKYQGESTQDVDAPQSGPTNQYNRALVELFEESGESETQALSLDHVHFTAEALRMIANHVGSLPGRKNLVWVAGSFPLNFESSALGRTADGRKIPFATDSELTMQALNNANMAIYPVDARGLIDPGPNGEGVRVTKEVDISSLGAMQNLARRTGGRAYFNSNDIMGSVRKTIDDSRVTYELGFYPAEVKWDGSFHAIRVKVNRPGVQVQTRDGYYALAKPDEALPTQSQLISEAAVSPVEATGIRVSVRVHSLSEEGQRKLGVSVFVPAEQLELEQGNGKWSDSVDITFFQLDNRKLVLQSRFKALPLSLDTEAYGRMMQEGLSLTGELEIQPNASELRVIVLDAGNGKIGSVDVPLDSYFPNKPN